ncbi:hypothetical protein P4O66_009845 [Electrophorus voltai]|uniref:Uncharacterized protein n=1 Tax=Electrophorus voltai TaxID=2609070 RepID=A0AAD8ZAF0_9TELE|nr:hypothetical protein P4O66_009845 [Electrophorus voltai]
MQGARGEHAAACGSTVFRAWQTGREHAGGKRFPRSDEVLYEASMELRCSSTGISSYTGRSTPWFLSRSCVHSRSPSQRIELSLPSGNAPSSHAGPPCTVGGEMCAECVVSPLAQPSVDYSLWPGTSFLFFQQLPNGRWNQAWQRDINVEFKKPHSSREASLLPQALHGLQSMKSQRIPSCMRTSTAQHQGGCLRSTTQKRLNINPTSRTTSTTEHLKQEDVYNRVSQTGRCLQQSISDRRTSTTECLRQEDVYNRASQTGGRLQQSISDRRTSTTEHLRQEDVYNRASQTGRCLQQSISDRTMSTTERLRQEDVYNRASQTGRCLQQSISDRRTSTTERLRQDDVYNRASQTGGRLQQSVSDRTMSTTEHLRQEDVYNRVSQTGGRLQQSISDRRTSTTERLRQDDVYNRVSQTGFMS